MTNGTPVCSYKLWHIQWYTARTILTYKLSQVGSASELYVQNTYKDYRYADNTSCNNVGLLIYKLLC